jgi:Tfp pilus assembly protein PilF
MRFKRWVTYATLVFLASSLYLLAFATPSIFYMSNVLLHVGLGTALALALVWLLWRDAELRGRMRWAAPLLLGGAALGGWLTVSGAQLPMRPVLLAHIWISLAGMALMRWRVAAAMVAVGLCVAGGMKLYTPRTHVIANGLTVPASMQEEASGPKSPFWPSSARTTVGGTIPSNFFMDSKLCGECHQDIYQQFQSSAHHFASFNNQFYRRSIEYMQDQQGTTQPSKWCAGCHDHAVFFNGRWERPMKSQADTPEAQNGLGCVSCHSISEVHNGTMGNGGFTIEYPPLHDLASSRNPWIRRMDRFLTFTAPEPHRQTFMKPFMRGAQSPEFCASCHKVHLDVPVNNYRWFRGFNDYDNWQASGVSGQGARSFYYPDKPMTCAECHMPQVPSKDAGSRNGMVHNHRFAAANSALAHVNNDATQLRAVEGFLKSGFITVDIFSAAPGENAPGVQMQRRIGESQQQAMSSFAVGEEAEAGGQFFVREVGQVAAPLDVAQPVFRPGQTARVDVVVRTRKIGHFFPAGTVDAFDVWLELQGVDATGKVIYWSGRTEDSGKGAVEPGAHFYRSYMLDGDGNPIDKRNAFEARSVLYVRLIPPGAADVAHFRVKIPPDAQGPITLTARLNYRKFTAFYTQFSYEGKSAPSLPTITLAQARSQLRLGDAKTVTEWKPVVRREDRERWNDWGIGMLLQGDLKGAEYAFTRVTEASPQYADGWLNVARALIQEGETEAAKPYVEKAMKLAPELARVWFFQALAQKADGDYDAALASLRQAAAKYPRDRVVLNQMGRILFLKRDYTGAVRALEDVLRVDPEDIQAHYNLMLSYRGLGDKEKAEREQRLFLRFKADESAQAITARIRMLRPEENNERQAIHEHEGVRLP